MVPEVVLGRTRLLASRLGLGLAAIGRPGYITLGRAQDLPQGRTAEALYERAAEMLDAARAAGVRYVDVARSYGRAEEFLARWIAERGILPDDLTIGSKWGYRYTADWRVDAPVHEEKELSLARFTTQLEESRGFLGDRLALYQIHSATVRSGCLDDVPLLRALVGGRRAGRYRAVGLTLSGPDSAGTLDRALAARVDGEPVFDTVQATFNCLEPSLAHSLRTAHDAGLGIIVKEALANGRLTDANPRPEDAAMVAKLRGPARRLGCAVDQLAVAYVAAHPFVDIVLSGAVTTDQLASHLGALHVTLDAKAVETVASIAEGSSRYWATRAKLPWT